MRDVRSSVSIAGPTTPVLRRSETWAWSRETSRLPTMIGRRSPGGGDAAIKKWIAEQMRGRSCTVVLVGSNTSGRKWINYEIKKSWDDGMGVVGIHVNGLKDLNGDISPRGVNPFAVVFDDNTGRDLSSIVKCYTPAGATSKERYDWIKGNLAAVVEEAIGIRQSN